MADIIADDNKKDATKIRPIKNFEKLFTASSFLQKCPQKEKSILTLRQPSNDVSNKNNNSKKTLFGQ